MISLEAPQLGIIQIQYIKRSRQRSSGHFFGPRLATVRALLLSFVLGIQPPLNAMNVEEMVALAFYHRAVISTEFAPSAGLFERHHADRAVFGVYIPLPCRHCEPAFYLESHFF